MLHIRYAIPEDFPEMVGLLNQLFTIEEGYKADPARQEEGLRLLASVPDNACLLVAESDGRVVGMCTAQVLISTSEGARSAWVEDVVIDDSYRGKGIAGKLLEAIGQWAVEKKVERLQLMADRENARALYFLEKNGWDVLHTVCYRKYV